WKPTFYARAITQIVGAENPFEPRFVLQHAAMEPERTSDQHDQRKPRPERQRESSQKNEMAEIHRVAREPIGAEANDPRARHSQPGGATRARMAKAATQEIWQIAPRHERHAPGHDRELAAMERKLERDHRQRAQDEGLHRRAAEPVPDAIDDRLSLAWFCFGHSPLALFGRLVDAPARRLSSHQRGRTSHAFGPRASHRAG